MQMLFMNINELLICYYLLTLEWICMIIIIIIIIFMISFSFSVSIRASENINEINIRLLKDQGHMEVDWRRFFFQRIVVITWRLL